MKLLGLLLLTAALLMGQGSADVELKAAMHKEQVQGDLKGAIAAYQEILRKHAANRSVAAQALVHMAECYQKQGDGEAKKVYERVVREFGDQRDAAAQARTRLAAMQPADSGSSLSYRRVWSGPKVDTEGSVSADGRYISFPDWSTGNQALHDLVTGEDRVLTNDGSRQRYAEHSVISPDGKKVAYARYNPDADHYELRVADATKDVAGPSTSLYSNQEDTWLVPLDWSRDGKWIAVRIQRNDQTFRTGLVSAIDGSLRVLESGSWADSGRIAFSPDSRFVAFSPDNQEGRKDRDIVVMTVDGNRKSTVVQHPANDKVVGWTPDGSYLLFSSDRSATIDLWGVPIENGEVAGAPVMLRSGIGNITPLGVTAKGALILAQRISGPEVYVASIDFQTGKKLSEPVSVIPEFVFDNAQAVWSPDGKQLAYVSRRKLGASSRSRLCVLTLATGEIRELSAQLNYYFRPRWSPDGKRISVNGADREGNQGVFVIDAEAASTKLVVASEKGESIDGADWSADGTKLYFRRAPKAQPSRLVERDLASGAEKTLLQSAGMTPGEVSPDGQWAVVRASEQVSPFSPKRLLLRVRDGEVRELTGDSNPIQWGAWSPDSRSFFVPVGKTELLRYDVSGGEPQKINLGFSTNQLQIHPDGRKIVYRDGNNAFEVWALENFLPRESAGR